MNLTFSAQSAGTDECTLAGVIITCIMEEAQKVSYIYSNKHILLTKYIILSDIVQ